jgi:hypothetical protein
LRQLFAISLIPTLSRHYDRLGIRYGVLRSICFVQNVSKITCIHEAAGVHICARFGDNHLRAVWRLSLGLGIVPAVAVFFWRLNMEEPARYKRDSMKFARIPYLLIFRRYGVRLIGISAVWCVLHCIKFRRVFLTSLTIPPFVFYLRFLYNLIVYEAFFAFP